MFYQIPLAPPGGVRGPGTNSLATPGTNAPSVFAVFISSVIGLMTLIAGIWFAFNTITGAIGILSSGGDKGKLESSRQRIVTGIIGIGVVVAAIFIVDLAGNFLGFPRILDPAGVFPGLILQ